jgi:hypothetical protein
MMRSARHRKPEGETAKWGKGEMVEIRERALFSFDPFTHFPFSPGFP